MNTPLTTPLLAVVPCSENLSAAIQFALPTLRRPRIMKLPLEKPRTTLTAPDAAAPGADGPALAVDAAELAFEAPVE